MRFLISVSHEPGNILATGGCTSQEESFNTETDDFAWVKNPGENYVVPRDIKRPFGPVLLWCQQDLSSITEGNIFTNLLGNTVCIQPIKCLW